MRDAILWTLISMGVSVLAEITRRELMHWRRARPDDPLWCDDCRAYCLPYGPCACCAAENAQAEARAREVIGEYDDGGPVTGEIRAVDDDEAWSAELARINADRRAGTLDELDEHAHLADTGQRRIFVALSDDPDLIEWDARQQAARAWEIAYVGFPALRAEIVRDYAAAAAALPAWPSLDWRKLAA
jgi:hypothetical protein